VAKEVCLLELLQKNNGFLQHSNGLDLSWPNSGGAIFVN